MAAVYDCEYCGEFVCPGAGDRVVIKDNKFYHQSCFKEAVSSGEVDEDGTEVTLGEDEDCEEYDE